MLPEVVTPIIRIGPQQEKRDGENLPMAAAANLRQSMEHDL
jgi:hypothetical protein